MRHPCPAPLKRAQPAAGGNPQRGPITASALATGVADPQLFRSSSHLTAWLGLVPRWNSSGGKERLGCISEQGNSHMRRLLIGGATAVLSHARSSASGSSSRATGLLQRRPAKVGAVAFANKAARVA